ncbi:N-acetylglucosaminyl transferase component Gpi1 [Rhizodiscina lignyota]|uniref:N-acetylglucosaminyl transferase component Gpi1 n=1 Tax=Rhizodiscina lignyota TaxID=1504668 RepID=A0A9P4M4H6_9PEZI|nr:N-acetylglucosaminyl transferase component Gpi1 [Rhizodiscina lignyota]
MHPFSTLAIGIFVAGYITARWDLVNQLYELAIFAWDHGVVTRTAKGFAILSVFFFILIIPAERIAAWERSLVRPLRPHSAGTHLPGRVASTDCINRYGDMVMSNGLMRLFWPSDAPTESTPGVLVGWRNSDYDALVVTILQEVEAPNVENALRIGTLFRNSRYPISSLLDQCGASPLRVLGTVNPTTHPVAFDPYDLTVKTSPSLRFPQLYCPSDTSPMVQVILYDRPDPTRMQYLSLKPIALALGDKSGSATKAVPPFDSIEEEEERERQRKLALVDKLRWHSVVKHTRTQKELALPIIIEQMNCSFEIATLLQKNIGLVGARIKRALSVSERVVESATNLWDLIIVAVWYILTEYVFPVMTQVFKLGLIAHRIAGELLLRVLEWRPFPEWAALKDVSATAQQVDIRLQQFCYWPIQYLTLSKRKSTWQSVTTSHPEYIRFYNSLWLVANDVIIGIALGSYIIENADFVANQIDNALTSWTIEGLQRMIAWLMDWPAGLKLNTELATFLGDLFLWVIEYWSSTMSTFRPYLPGVIRFIGFSAFAGATMPMSLLSDLLSLLTLHIYSFYIASARIYNWQLTIIISLFHLFRGKKRNVLRNRIDSCDYDLDQLLLGTILFTLLFFLLPTVFVFYATFAGARMGVICVKAGLDTLLALLNHFPLFALMLRFKDSRRLPGGIRFQLRDTREMSAAVKPNVPTNAPTSYIYLKSIPLPLGLMFNEYFQLGTRIKKHYVSPGVLLCLVSGRFVPPIHRKNLYSLQYSMLPARRFPIAALWRLLNEADKMASKEEIHQNDTWRVPMSMTNGGLGGKNHALNGLARRRKR